MTVKKIVLALTIGLLSTACCQDRKTAAEYLTDYSKAVLDSKASSICFKTIAERDSGTETMEVYVEPAPTDTIIGIRFQATSDDSRIVYNGTELFVIGLRDSYSYLQTNDYEQYPIMKPFIPISGYSGTPFSFARVFPKIVADSTAQTILLPDTLVNGLKCRQIQISLMNKSIYGEMLHQFSNSMSQEFHYKFIFSKEDGLLRGKGMANDAGGYDMIYFTDYVFNQPQTDRKWMFADYPNAKPYQRIEYQMLTVGSSMPEFSASIDGKGEIGRSYLEQKPVMMLFWTMGCGASRMAIPLVNKLHDKYPDIKVFALNNEDQDLERITKFVAKYDIRYPVARGNREAALAFGVNGWPTFMIFGKDGKLQFVQMGITDTIEQTLCEKVEKAIKGN